MKIAVIGGGATGVFTADRLASDHAVTLYERQDRLGGHVESLALDSGACIDLGVYSFYRPAYPEYARLLKRLGIKTRPINMSFLHEDVASGIVARGDVRSPVVLSATTFSKRPWRKYLYWFAKLRNQLMSDQSHGVSVVDFYRRSGLPSHFLNLACQLPMRVAYGMTDKQIQEMDIRRLADIMKRLDLLSMKPRYGWRGIVGGVATYMSVMTLRLQQKGCCLRLNEPVLRVRRDGNNLVVKSYFREDTYDRVVVAAPPYLAHKILSVEDPRSKALKAIPMQPMEITYHRDRSALATKKRLATHVLRTIEKPGSRVTEFHYDCERMYHDQRMRGVYVSVSPQQPVKRDAVLATRKFHHVIYSDDTVAATNTLRHCDGFDGIYLAGAYDGWGLHESAYVAAKRAAGLCRQPRIRDRLALADPVVVNSTA